MYDRSSGAGATAGTGRIAANEPAARAAAMVAAKYHGLQATGTVDIVIPANDPTWPPAGSVEITRAAIDPTSKPIAPPTRPITSPCDNRRNRTRPPVALADPEGTIDCRLSTC